MFVYKENMDLMRREQVKTGRNGEKLDVGSTSIGGSNTITINNTNKNSLTSEGVKQTSVAVDKKEQNKTAKQTNRKNSSKKSFPTYDVKIIGGKKVIIYHDQKIDKLNSSKHIQR